MKGVGKREMKRKGEAVGDTERDRVREPTNSANSETVSILWPLLGDSKLIDRSGPSVQSLLPSYLSKFDSRFFMRFDRKRKSDQKSITSRLESSIRNTSVFNEPNNRSNNLMCFVGRKENSCDFSIKNL